MLSLEFLDIRLKATIPQRACVESYIKICNHPLSNMHYPKQKISCQVRIVKHFLLFFPGSLLLYYTERF